MSKKVLEIQGLLKNNPDTLAVNMVSTYRGWRNQLAVKIEEWKEVQKYIFATDTTTTTNQSLPWRNTTTLPKIAQIRDNLHAQYMDALFPNDDWLIWEGDSPEDVQIQKRKKIESYIKNKAIASGIREVISDLLYDYIDYDCRL